VYFRRRTGAVKKVHTALWPHYLNKDVFSDCQNRVYGRLASLRCGTGSKLFHSPGPTAAKALSPKVLWVWVMTHVRLSVELSWRTHTRRDSVMPSVTVLSLANNNVRIIMFVTGTVTQFWDWIKRALGPTCAMSGLALISLVLVRLLNYCVLSISILNCQGFMSMNSIN